jgi:serine/threonine-protein kinase
MAPEQCRGQPLDARTDQYALAIVAFELFTGRRPIAGASIADVMERQIQTAPLRPRLANPALSSETEAVLLRGLEKAPSDRYPSIRDFGEALAASIAERTDQGVQTLPSRAAEIDEPTLPMIN